MNLSRFSEPKLNGVIVKEAVRCGKRNCHCVNGKLHRWYFYLYFRVLIDGIWRLKKEYVPKAKVRYLRAKIKASKRRNRFYIGRSTTNESLLFSTNSFISGKLTGEEYLNLINEIN